MTSRSWPYPFAFEHTRRPIWRCAKAHEPRSRCGDRSCTTSYVRHLMHSVPCLTWYVFLYYVNCFAREGSALHALLRLAARFSHRFSHSGWEFPLWCGNSHARGGNSHSIASLGLRFPGAVPQTAQLCLLIDVLFRNGGSRPSPRPAFLVPSSLRVWCWRRFAQSSSTRSGLRPRALHAVHCCCRSP